ncbi:MAG: hypothetical protein WDA03_14945, partial [Trueperaceae bacterium]
GPSYNIFDGANVWPRRTPLGRFEGNLAHSNQNDGLHVDRGPNQETLAAETASYRPRVDPTNRDSDPAPAYFENFVAYKHRGEAAWFRGDHTHLVGALLADNAVGATFASNASGMSDSVVVFRSANLGHAEPWEPTENGVPIPRPWDSGKDFPPRGFQFYDGQVYVKDSYFAGFEPFGQRLAGAISFLDHTSFSLSPLSFAEGLSFHEGTTRVMFADMTAGAYMSVEERAKRAQTNDSGNDGYASGMFIDLDGSITGAAGYAVTVNNPMMLQPGCSYNAEWNAQVCAERFASLTYNNTSGRALELAPLSLHQGSVGSAASHTMFGSPKGGTSVPNTHFRALVPLGNEFHYQHGGNPSDELTIELGGVNPGDSLIVSLPYAGSSPFVYRDWWIHQNNLVQRYGSLNLLRSATDTGYFYEEGRLYLKLQVREGRDYAHLTVCRVEVCN